MIKEITAETIIGPTGCDTGGGGGGGTTDLPCFVLSDDLGLVFTDDGGFVLCEVP